VKTKVQPSPAGGSKTAAKLTPVVVRTTPQGANIYIDGDFKGTTPLTLMLPVERHQIRIIRTGYETVERQIAIEETMEYPLAFNLKPTDGPEGPTKK
jgi:hypothetical protein